MTRRRLARAAVAVAALFSPEVSEAGTYEVLACDAAPGRVNHSWSPWVPGERMRAQSDCSARGILVSNLPGAGQPGVNAQAWQTFWAPSGARITAITYSGGFWRPGTSEPGAEDYTAELVNVTGSPIDGCPPGDRSRCTQWFPGGRTIPVPSAEGIAIVASCFGFRCRDGVASSPPEFAPASVMARLTSARVRVSDGTLPVTAVDGGDLIGSWARGVRAVNYRATDNVGIRTVRASVGGVERAQATLSCDYTRNAPCPGAPAGSLSIDTTALGDGIHPLRLEAVDAAANEGRTETAIRVDNTPPETTLAGAGSPGRPHPGPVTLALTAWDATAGMGGDARVVYRVDGGTWVSAGGDEATIAIAGAGDHRVEYHAVDAAGNASADQVRELSIRAGVESAAPADGFSARAANPSTFTAARRFGAPCPDATSLTASRDAPMLVGFALPAAPDCTVQAATLRLYATSGPGRRVSVTRASSSWDEATVTSQTRPGSAGAEVVAITPAAVPGWVEWDVTDQVQAIYRHGDNGLHLRSESGPVEFCSREDASPVCAAGRPQLELRFGE